MSYRWLLLGTLAAAIVVAGYGVWLAPWIDVPDFATIKLEHSSVERLPQFSWLLAAIGTAFVGFGMVKERAAAFVPGTSALVTAIVTVIGAGTMFFVSRTINSATALDRFANPTQVGVAIGAWLAIVGFGVAALAALSLVRVAASRRSAP